MKFTNEQQKNIAADALKENDYKAIGQKYDISYQQVAAWVRKYQAELTGEEKSTDSTRNSKKEQTDNQKSSKVDKDDQASTLDVLSRRDPVLEKQLEDVKRRLGLIK
ncbi:helix-turn-helix domain-containing protein [Companilactobacillus versmoldensis]|uniref:Transposase IS3 IS911 family protein n=1 Tax=Companilactobacillus versmoldensis DSM 14857 = KCTC 3814 TaxID=1423815 RepID=A0A0R1SFA1_9LACO|nr:helix-turn-helix domain-containing protein [Companilactobacillus versmoldensis]KRL67824.1 transposase IS3 IS911 family protein [Companilactobacillus versmoldensis DSM 14857 = KCTC 3814]